MRPRNYFETGAMIAAALSGKSRYPIVGRGILGFWHPDSQRERFVKPTHIGHAARNRQQVNR